MNRVHYTQTRELLCIQIRVTFMTRTSERRMTVISRVLAPASFILLLATLSAPMVVARGADADFDPQPLQPAEGTR